jgi:hypothetical protein
MERNDVDWKSFFNNSTVCHYTKRETALEHIFHSGKIKFGKLENTNDPYETETWQMAQMGNNILNDLGKEIEIVDQVQQAFTDIKRSLWVFCCSTDSNDPICRNKTHGSFGRCFANAANWAHYAGNHSGVCLVFDKHKLDDIINATFQIVHSTSVTYDLSVEEYENTFIAIRDLQDLPTSIINHFNHKILPLLFKKHFFWAGENEYRIIVLKENADNIEIPIQQCLKSIIIGHNFPRCYLPSIKQSADKYNIELNEITWVRSVPYIGIVS